MYAPALLSRTYDTQTRQYQYNSLTLLGTWKATKQPTHTDDKYIVRNGISFFTNRFLRADVDFLAFQHIRLGGNHQQKNIPSSNEGAHLHEHGYAYGTNNHNNVYNVPLKTDDANTLHEFKAPAFVTHHQAPGYKAPEYKPPVPVETVTESKVSGETESKTGHHGGSYEENSHERGHGHGRERVPMKFKPYHGRGQPEKEEVPQESYTKSETYDDSNYNSDRDSDYESEGNYDVRPEDYSDHSSDENESDDDDHHHKKSHGHHSQTSHHGSHSSDYNSDSRSDSDYNSESGSEFDSDKTSDHDDSDKHKKHHNDEDYDEKEGGGYF